MHIVKIGGHRYVDYGVFFDGRAKTLARYGFKDCDVTEDKGKQQPKETKEDKLQKARRTTEKEAAILLVASLGQSTLDRLQRLQTLDPLTQKQYYCSFALHQL